MNQEEFVASLSQLRPASTFLVLHKYRNKFGELADYNIVFHISYKNALERSISRVLDYSPPDDLHRRAKEEVLTSYRNSLERMATTSVHELEDNYHRFTDEENRVVEGVKLHIESNILHLFGFIHNKRIIEPGVYHTVNSHPLTLAKRKIQKLGTLWKWRQFQVHPTKLEKVVVEKITLLPPEDTCDLSDES